jgi:amino acid transporter
MIASLIYLIVYIVIVGVVMFLLRYLVDAIPMDPPIRQVAHVAILVIGILIIILLLLSFVGAIDGGLPRLAR